MAQVSGKNGGYYGCLAAKRGSCENKTLVLRSLVQMIVLGAVTNKLADTDAVTYVLQRVESEIQKLGADLPEALKLKEAELNAEQRRLTNFLDFIGEGRGSQALGKALIETERRVDALTDEVDALRRGRDQVFTIPPSEWISHRLNDLQGVLEKRTARSAMLLREVLGPIRLDLVKPDIGRPFYRASTGLDALALIETPLDPSAGDSGSTSLQKWTLPGSNR